MLKKLTVIVPILVSSCSQYAEYTPSGDTLKDAITGTPYSAKIYIFGGRVIKPSFSMRLFPENTGLYLKPCDPLSVAQNNCILVEGIPKKPGSVTIKISGGLYGSMIVSSAGFHKEYTMNVISP